METTGNPYQSPQNDAYTDYSNQEYVKLSAAQILFSFEGRIPRRVYWGYSILVTVVFYFVYFLLLAALGAGADSNGPPFHPGPRPIRIDLTEPIRPARIMATAVKISIFFIFSSLTISTDSFSRTRSMRIWRSASFLFSIIL